jgi:hypothetical protein
VNINEMVEVDLTAQGRLALYKYEIGIGIPVHTASRMNGKRLRIQLWDLMHVFGPEMVMGREPCFEGNVIHLPNETAATE